MFSGEHGIFKPLTQEDDFNGDISIPLDNGDDDANVRTVDIDELEEMRNQFDEGNFSIDVFWLILFHNDRCTFCSGVW